MMAEKTIHERRADWEVHDTVGELAKAWHMGRRTLHAWFRDEPGVLKFGGAKLKKGQQRTHVSLRIPESVARRVYRQRTGQDVYPARGN